MWTILAIIATILIIMWAIKDEPINLLFLIVVFLVYGILMAISYGITEDFYNPPVEHKIIAEKTEYDFTFTVSVSELEKARIAQQSGGKIKFIQLATWESEPTTNWAIWPFTLNRTIPSQWIVVPYNTEVDL